jgi:curved DNA-binding protein CbpA/MinD-like ATPase involved in chromosome partitioning or flagellar assembly
MSSTDLENIEPHSLRPDAFSLDSLHEENHLATDYYEILRVGPQADGETIDRVYRTLADRFHPDNPNTGDPETFLRVREAYETLSSQADRAKYNASRQNNNVSTRFRLRGREFFDGVRGGQNRRLALLCILYRQRISTHDLPGLTILDLEQLTGCTREEVTSALWYLCEKQWATLGELTAYSITVDGFDFVESKLEDRLEFRSLATMRYYRSTGERESSDTLPLDIEPAITSEGDVFISDHYEILGIGPQADEEAIERIYRTLAGRFHPDNPSTGDVKTYLRIREAYDTLSDQTRRAQYNALRQRTKYSERFRLRGREFFDGIKGEQLRRLAVLCLLYRQAASELSALTVLDLEQLTGCTREELGSSLWYLREKKWANYGEFTEYSITAAGFDVVENKLDDREAARSRAWLTPDGARSATQSAWQDRQNVPAISQSLTADTTVNPENWNSRRTVESEKVHIKPEDAPDEQTANMPVPQTQNVAVTPQSPMASISPNWDPQIAGMSPTDIFQQLLRLQKAEQSSEEQLAAIPESAQIGKLLSPGGPDRQAASSTGRLAPEAIQGNESLRPAVQIEPNAPQSNINRGQPMRVFVRKLFGFDGGAKPVEQDPTAFRGPDEPPAPQALRAEDRAEVPVAPESAILDTIAPENRNSEWIAKSGQADIEPGEPSQKNMDVVQGVREDTQGNEPANPEAGAAQLSAQSQSKIEVAPQSPILDTIAPEKQNSEWIAKSAQADIQAAEPSQENREVVQGLPEDTQGSEPANPEASAAQPVAGSQPKIEVTPQSPGVTGMSNATQAVAEPIVGLAVGAAKRVIFSMGGKGGVGKTSVMTGLAEWFEENRIPVTLLDLDIENKACGSLAHFFAGRVPKINIHTPAGLDSFVDHLGDDSTVILADMGAGAGHVTHDWFDTMYPDVADAGVVFTAIGVVTSDPASVESVLTWATALQDRVDYVVVENKLTEHADFTYWQKGDEAREFQKRFQPAIVRLDNRLADLENAARNYGVTLGRVAGRTAGQAELQKASLVMRAQSYRRRMFAEFDKVKELLLP